MLPWKLNRNIYLKKKPNKMTKAHTKKKIENVKIKAD